MQGWQVVTSNDEKVGKVVDEIDGFLIVEQGHLHKTRHPLPKSLAHLREQDEEVCISIPRDLIHDAPKVGDDGEFDHQLASEHYGLAGAMEQPPTKGDGEVDPDDPAYGPDRDADAAGLMHPDEHRARLRAGKRHERFPSSPSFLGDRKRK
jgi:hypothetical protein